MAIPKLIDEITKESEKYPILVDANAISLETVTSPVMRGTTDDRKFIVMKLLVDNEIVIQTIMQAYHHLMYYWIGGNVHSLSGRNDYLGDPELELLLSVMKGNTETIDHRGLSKWYSCTTGSYGYMNINSTGMLGFPYNGCQVSLYDEEKWDAAVQIQRYWRVCRYNPEYKMCSNVQLHNIEDVYTENGKVLA
jgi:hypothetical protein